MSLSGKNKNKIVRHRLAHLCEGSSLKSKIKMSKVNVISVESHVFEPHIYYKA